MRPFTVGADAVGSPRNTLSASAEPAGGLAVGEQRDWPSAGFNGTTSDGQVVDVPDELRGYTLRGLGDSIEVWVANELAFPAGDCRNDLSGGALLSVTAEQAQAFADEFDDTVLPVESTVFSIAPDRDGTAAQPQVLSDVAYPADYWVGDGNRTVALIDNVRDQNFYDPTNVDGRTFVAGFFSAFYNESFDRNIMTIDGFDWLHRTGTTPPDDSDDPAYRACAAYLQRAGLGSPEPRAYEGVFAHEYHHLLSSYADPDELSWVNEGLSDWSMSRVGYTDPSLPVDDRRSTLAPWFGWNPDPAFGGPEQSLTQFGDQGGPEILADYAIGEAFTLYLSGRFGGDPFISALHNEPDNGLAGLQAVLDRTVPGIQALDVLHDFLAMAAVDGAIDSGATVKHGNASHLASDAYSGKINWDTPQAYDAPGAPPNGADYVRLRDLDGYLSDGLITFVGARNYPTARVEWTVRDGDLFSGSGNDLDRSLVRTVTVPADIPTLTIDLDVDTEPFYDEFFVQVYDTPSQTWVTVPGGSTDPETRGLSGQFSGEEVYDLSTYAGEDVDIALRYVSDGSIAGPGITVHSLRVGTAELPDLTDLSTWRTITQAHPVPVPGWTVQLVGYDEENVSAVHLPVVATPWGWTTAAPVSLVLGFTPDVAAVLVTVDDPSESAPSGASYQLFANGVLQPGGGSGG